MDIIRKHFETIDSTNTWAKQHAPEFDKNHLTLITASEQTAGRGRFKRKWESPPNQNIYATFCFFIEKHREDIKNLPQVLSISACKVVENLGFEPKLKWPNDVLISGKKMAGILCETVPLSGFLCVVLGIGLNVNMPLEILQKIDRPATSLFAEDNVQRDVEEVTLQLQQQFVQDLEYFLEYGFHHFLQIYKTYIVHVEGDLIRFHDNRIVWEGTFKSVNEDGSLNLQLSSGEYKTFHAGEIL
jgi:BirA family biotin operon repressor/biotin-[acetyl-CoA-carboxylase] ligase